MAKIAEGTEEDVNIAVEAARRAFDTVWGLNTPGTQRAQYLWNLASLMEQHQDELAAIESLDNGGSSELCFPSNSTHCRAGKTFKDAKNIDLTAAISVLKYYAGWADKVTGQVSEVHAITWITRNGSLKRRTFLDKRG